MLKRARIKLVVLALALCVTPVCGQGLDSLIQSAGAGDVANQLEVADRYAHGRGVEVDLREAAKWYRLAAEQGDAVAQSRLSQMYAKGTGVRRNPREALKWLRSAAMAGNADSQTQLAQVLYQGDGVEKNLAEAAFWFRRSAEQGVQEAQEMLGRMFFLGEGVPQDFQESATWYHLAAEQKIENAKTDADASEPDSSEKNNTSPGKQDGEDSGGEDSRENTGSLDNSAESQERAQDQSERQVGEQINSDRESIQEKDQSKPPGTSSGSTQPQGEPQTQPAELRHAAEQGDAQAQEQLGDSYANGSGVAKNRREAEKWYRRASAQGSESAEQKLQELANHSTQSLTDSSRPSESSDAEDDAEPGQNEAAEQKVEHAEKVTEESEGASSRDQDSPSGEDGEKLDEGDAAEQAEPSGNSAERQVQEEAQIEPQAGEQSTPQRELSQVQEMGDSAGTPADSNEPQVEARTRAFNLRRAAEQGSVQAQEQLGDSYASGTGVTQNRREAEKWYQRAAAQGSETAKQKLRALAVQSTQEQTGPARSSESSDAEDETDSEQRGVAVQTSEVDESPDGGLSNQAASQNEVEEKDELASGQQTENVEGSRAESAENSKDEMQNEAAKLRTLAEKGDAAAQDQLGDLYASGTGVKQNRREAEKWYLRAASQGFEAARRKLDELKESRPGKEDDSNRQAEDSGAASGNPTDQRESGQEEVQEHSVAEAIAVEQAQDVEESKDSGQETSREEQEANEQAKKGRETADGLKSEQVSEIQEMHATELREFAESGDARAQEELADRYAGGEGVPENLREAKKWYEQAASQGRETAQQKLRDLPDPVISEQSSSEESSESTTSSAAESSGQGKQGEAANQEQSAQVRGAENESSSDKRKRERAANAESAERPLENPDESGGAGEVEEGKADLMGNVDQRVAELLESADAGGVEAQLELARLYSDGAQIEQDHAKAMHWYEQAARQGAVEAQSALAIRYYTGVGVDKDTREAAQWARKAATAGDADAQLLLAGLLYEGDGVRQDAESSFQWARRAAEQGNARAQMVVAYQYAAGQGVPQDLTTAYAWALVAEINGYSLEDELQERLEKELTSYQKRIARQKAEEMTRSSGKRVQH